MTTLRASPDTVRFVDGRWWDRLRRVDPRIWDTLGAVVLGVLAFALRAQRPDEPPAALGFALVVVAGASLAGLTGCRLRSRRASAGRVASSLPITLG
jgi:drug/metabolite transporter (DMT)-like permease